MDPTAGSRMSPIEVLDRLFDKIRDQASKDPAFADSLIKSLGVTVYYEGEDALKASDPVYLTGLRDKQGFVAIYNIPSFKVGDLKKLMKEQHLATATDLKVKRSKQQLIEFMYERANDKRLEMRSD